VKERREQRETKGIDKKQKCVQRQIVLEEILQKGSHAITLALI
jgi:hypothetical protein